MSFFRLVKYAIAIHALLISTMLQAGEKLTVFAAASLTDALTVLANEYEKTAKLQIQSSFASSGTLAKQIENGAPADIFISADTKWVNYLKDKKVINAASISNLLANDLVLIVPKGKRFDVRMQKGFDFFGAFEGKICTGEMESVPAGIYAKQAFSHLGWLAGAKSRVVGTQDVRSALSLVERGECAAGIVYATDAKVSNHVEVIALFPDETHDPIVYPITLTNLASPQAKAFYQYLKSNQAKKVFTQYGFSFIEAK